MRDLTSTPCQALQRFQINTPMSYPERRIERDRLRTARQAPVSRYRVIYLVNGRERKSAWLNEQRAEEGLRMMQAKYGERKAIIYID